jgi:hypothetical protein
MKRGELPIKHWSHSSLMAYLRNPLAWYKRYVEEVYDLPTTPSSVVGRAAHKALEHFYGGLPKEAAVALGLEQLRNTSDFEINFGRSGKTKAGRRKRREAMEREYAQVMEFFLKRPPKYQVLGVEVKGVVEVKGLPLPLKAVSDLVVKSKIDPRAVDIVDYKFVDSFSPTGAYKALFVIQAIFNYYTVREKFGKPVRRFIVHECKKTRNMDGKSQMRTYKIDFRDYKSEFGVFHRLVTDATEQLSSTRVYLPNPSDIFEGENSFDIYRLGLAEE